MYVREKAISIGLATAGKSEATLAAEIAQAELGREQSRREFRKLFPDQDEGLNDLLSRIPDVRMLPETEQYEGSLGYWDPWKEYVAEKERLDALIQFQNASEVLVEDYLEAVQDERQLRNAKESGHFPTETAEFELFLVKFTETLPLLTYILALEYPLFRAHLVRSDIQKPFLLSQNSEAPIEPGDDQERELLVRISRSTRLFRYLAGMIVSSEPLENLSKPEREDMARYESLALLDESGDTEFPRTLPAHGGAWTASRQEWILRATGRWGYRNLERWIGQFLESAPAPKLAQLFEILEAQGWDYPGGSDEVSIYLDSTNREELGRAFAEFLKRYDQARQISFLTNAQQEGCRKLYNGAYSVLGTSLPVTDLSVAVAYEEVHQSPTRNYAVDAMPDLRPLVVQLRATPELLLFLGAKAIYRLTRETQLDLRTLNIADALARLPPRSFIAENHRFPVIMDSFTALLLLGADASARVTSQALAEPYLYEEWAGEERIKSLVGMPCVGVARSPLMSELLLDFGADRTLSSDMVTSQLGELFVSLEYEVYHTIDSSGDDEEYLMMLKKGLRGDEMYTNGRTLYEEMHLSYKIDIY